MADASAKRRTSISVSAGLLDAARDYDLNVSAITEAALADAVRHAREEAWRRENAAAIEQRRRWTEKNGPPLAGWQVWRPE